MACAQLQDVFSSIRMRALPALQAPQTWPPRMERGEMAALVLTLGEGVERFRLTPEGARGFTVEGLRDIWKVCCG